MDNQSFGRHQRPRGANIKQALQVLLLLAACAWLVYQIKYSNKAEDYGYQTKLDEEYGAVSLGRKGTPSWLDDRAVPNSGNVNFVGEAKKANSGRNEAFVGAVEDNDEKEFGHDENFSADEGKEVEKEPEKQSFVSAKNKTKDPSKDDHGKVHVKSKKEPDHKEEGKMKYTKVPVINNSQSGDNEQAVQIREPPKDVYIRMKAKSDGLIKGTDEDEDLKISEKEAKMQENLVESAKNVGLTERIDEVRSFHDENGVPPDGNETEPMGGQAHTLHEKSISSFSKESGLGKSNTYEVISGEGTDVEITLGSSTMDATAGGEINSESGTHVETSGFNHSETR